ncbi:MAG: hypothetical protein M5U14_02375 [Acidimicrobiia bacterium]|nr:hypothetical protein [Acidimicrobiia bacterium]
MRVIELWQWIVVFVLAGAVLLRAGVVLAGAGDEIAARTGLGGLLIGAVLVALATSLPELATTVSAVAADAPDLAVGGILGSSMANMAILAVIDLVHRGRVWPSVEIGQAKAGSVAIVLTTVVVVGIVQPTEWEVGWLGPHLVLVGILYVATVAWMRRPPRGEPEGIPTTGEVPVVPTGWRSRTVRQELRPAVRRFALASFAILLAGPAAAISGEGIADETGISQSFVGVALLAVATSLPELVASLGAVRIGAYDLAAGNLFGSNALNLVALVVADAAYGRGSLLAAVEPAEALAGMVAIGLMALALAAIVHGGETRVLRLEPGPALLLVAYAAGLVAVWSAGR